MRVLLVARMMMVIIVIIVKMTLQLLMLLMKRISRWRKKTKAILLATVTTPVVLFGRTWKIIMGSLNKGDEIGTTVYVIHY
jgi:heme/copper-type cytochrome/quinol oxidase subunit 4